MAMNRIGTGGPLNNVGMTIALGPSETFVLPAGQGVVGTFGGSQQGGTGFTGFTMTGQYMIQMGPYTVLQMYDANLQTWRIYPAANLAGAIISSDGTNWRLANTTGCAIGSKIVAAGSAATNGFNTVTVTPSAGGSTWNTIVGGAVNTTLTLTGAVYQNTTFGATTGSLTGSQGSAYTRPPLVVFNPPSTQGSTPYVLPTAVSAITGGIVSSITVTNQGAGLVGLPGIQIIPQPGDTTGGGAVAGWLAAANAMVGSGTLLMCYPGGGVSLGLNQSSTSGTPLGTAGLTAVPTLSFTGLTTGTATVIMNFTVTTVSVAAAGAGYGNAQPFGIVSSGAQVAGTAINTNPMFDNSLILPRNLSAYGTTTTAGGALVQAAIVIHDAGFGYQAVPNLFPLAGGTAVAVTTQAQLTAVVGGQNDVSVIFPF